MKYNQKSQHTGDEAVKRGCPGQGLTLLSSKQLLIGVFSRNRLGDRRGLTDSAVTGRPVSTADSRVRKPQVGAQRHQYDDQQQGNFRQGSFAVLRRNSVLDPFEVNGHASNQPHVAGDSFHSTRSRPFPKFHSQAVFQWNW